MRVRDYMTRTPTVRTQAATATAVDLIVEHRLQFLPVVDDEGRFAGVLPAVDVHLIRLDPILKEFSVFHFMRYGVPVIEACTPIERAARLFEENPRFETLAVLSNGRFEGLLMRDELEEAASTETEVDSSVWLG